LATEPNVTPLVAMAACGGWTIADFVSTRPEQTTPLVRPEWTVEAENLPKWGVNIGAASG
jgi:hypothetical protein